MNVYGEREANNKFIGKVLSSINKNEKIVLHGTSKKNVASRHWIHAEEVASAVLFLLNRAKSKEVYHIAGEEMDVYTLASKLYFQITEKLLDDSQIEYMDFHSARKGHDKRYSLSNKKLLSMGWEQKIYLNEGIKRVTEFYKNG